MYRQSRAPKASAECLSKAIDRGATSDVAMAKFHSPAASNPQGKSVVVFLITWSGAIGLILRLMVLTTDLRQIHSWLWHLHAHLLHRPGYDLRNRQIAEPLVV